MDAGAKPPLKPTGLPPPVTAARAEPAKAAVIPAEQAGPDERAALAAVNPAAGPGELSAILARIGPVSETHSQREREMPYTLPPIVLVAEPGHPLELSALDPAKSYTWVVDPHGRFLVAPEVQEGFGKTEAQPEGRKVKHGDLCAGPGGRSRGPARAGGELRAAQQPDGSYKWVLDMNSSYSFNRADGKVLKDDNGRAVVEYLVALGSNGALIEAGGNVYSPLLALAGKAIRFMERIGLGALTP